MCYAMLERNGQEKCKVKAISLSIANDIPAEMMAKIDNKECDWTAFYFQDYKIACANVKYESVLQFLRKKEYVQRGFFLKTLTST